MTPNEVGLILSRILGAAVADEGGREVARFRLPGGLTVEPVAAGRAWRVGGETHGVSVDQPGLLEAAILRALPRVAGLGVLAGCWLALAADPDGASLRDASLLDAITIRDLAKDGLVETRGSFLFATDEGRARLAPAADQDTTAP